MLTADTQLDVRSGLPSLLNRHLDQLAYTALVQSCKRIGLVDFLLVIIPEELSCIISGEAKGHLGQIVGSEGEEFSFLCDLICKQGCSRDLDHRADVVLDIGILFLLHQLCSFNHHILHILQFLPLTD